VLITTKIAEISLFTQIFYIKTDNYEPAQSPKLSDYSGTLLMTHPTDTNQRFIHNEKKNSVKEN
jgi:hypothetical protein